MTTVVMRATDAKDLRNNPTLTKCCHALSRSSSAAARRSSPLRAVRPWHPGSRRGGSAAPAVGSRPTTRRALAAEESRRLHLELDEGESVVSEDHDFHRQLELAERELLLLPYVLVLGVRKVLHRLHRLFALGVADQ